MFTPAIASPVALSLTCIARGASAARTATVTSNVINNAAATCLIIVRSMYYSSSRATDRKPQSMLTSSHPKGETPMNYRRLGDAGVKLSEIGLGGWLTFGNAVDMEQGRKVM